MSNLGAMGLQVNPEVVVGSEQEDPGADLRVGLGGRAGVRLSDHLGPSFGGAICHRGAARQSGAMCPVSPADGGKSPWRYGLRGSSHTAGGDRHGGVDASDGAFVNHGADNETWALAKPLLLTVLLPLLVGAAIRHYAGNWQPRSSRRSRCSPGSPLLTILLGLVLYVPADARHRGELGPALHDPVHGRDGSDDVSIRLWPDTVQRSVMALGMGTRNIAAVLAGCLPFRTRTRA